MRNRGRKLEARGDLPAVTCRLLFVRHATAEGNGRFTGQRDVSLATTSRKELRFLIEKCSQYPLGAVYSSDLERARQTAAAFAREFGLDVEVRPGLREMHFGQWEGLSWEQVAKRFPQLAHRWTEHFPRQPIPGAELFRDFKKRVDLEVRHVIVANQGRCAVIVTHAGVIRVALAKVLGVPERNLFRLAQDPCALNVVDYSPEGAIARCINA